MSITHRTLLSCGTWMTGLAVAVILLMSLGAHAQAPTVSNDGAVEGLEPKFVDVEAFGGTIKTRYYEAGQGEPLVLVHGGGFAGYYSANVWSKNILGLGERFHVFAPDKLAAGMTDNPPEDKYYNLQGEVEHMYQFIQAMNLDQVHLVGQSRGAGLALLLAVAHPEVVKTLVLVNSGTASPQIGPNMHEILMAECPGDPDESLKCEMRILSYEPNAEVAFPDEYFSPAFYMGHQPKSQTAIAKMAAGAGEPLRSEWNEWKKRLHERLRAEKVLPMPVLLVWGTNDPQATLKHGTGLYDILAIQHPNVWLFLVNKAGHFHFREYPDEFNDQLIGFIDYWNGRQAESTSDR